MVRGKFFLSRGENSLESLIFVEETKDEIMKTRLLNSLLCAAVCLTALPAFAQSSYETPEFSGPTARFDRELETRRDQDNALRASRARLEEVQRMRKNDLAVERHNTYRAERVQDEMARKREESLRANQRYILQTNE